jgi:hypothetical protein
MASSAATTNHCADELSNLRVLANRYYRDLIVQQRSGSTPGQHSGSTKAVQASQFKLPKLPKLRANFQRERKAVFNYKQKLCLLESVHYRVNGTQLGIPGVEDRAMISLIPFLQPSGQA